MRTLLGSVLVLTLGVVAVSTASPAMAYGPEGLFGGRPEPDSTVVLVNPVELKNDRPDRAETVLDHPRPEFDAVPIEIGSFQLFPSIEVGQSFDSNIYVAKNNTKEDLVNTIRPIVSVFSNWGRHAVSMTTFGDVNIYDTHSHENYQNFVTDWNGRYDIVNQSWVSVRGGFQHLTESRSSPDAAFGTEPNTFTVAKGGFGFYRGVGIVSLATDYDIRRFDYNDIKTNSTIVGQSQRNHEEHVLGTKVAYEKSGNFKPYVSAHLNNHDYDNATTMQSHGYDAVVGSTMDFGGITSAEVYVGAMGQRYRHSLLERDVFAPKFGGRLEWNVTGLTSVLMEVSRTIEDTQVNNFNSYIASGGSTTLTHELRRNLLAEANVSFTRYDFQGSDTRQDDNMTAGGGMRYFVNRNIYGDLSYNWSNRASSDSSLDYDRHMVMARVGFRP